MKRNKKNQRRMDVVGQDSTKRPSGGFFCGPRRGVEWLRTGDGVISKVIEEKLDLAILDFLLPGRDGLRVLRDLGRRGHFLPVLMLAALASPPERIAGLDARADDYLGNRFTVGRPNRRVEGQILLSRSDAGRLDLQLAPFGWSPHWKWIGGPSWCILSLLVVLLKTGVELSGNKSPTEKNSC